MFKNVTLIISLITIAMMTCSCGLRKADIEKNNEQLDNIEIALETYLKQYSGNTNLRCPDYSDGYFSPTQYGRSVQDQLVQAALLNVDPWGNKYNMDVKKNCYKRGVCHVTYRIYSDYAHRNHNFINVWFNHGYYHDIEVEQSCKGDKLPMPIDNNSSSYYSDFFSVSDEVRMKTAIDRCKKTFCEKDEKLCSESCNAIADHQDDHDWIINLCTNMCKNKVKSMGLNVDAQTTSDICHCDTYHAKTYIFED